MKRFSDVLSRLLFKVKSCSTCLFFPSDILKIKNWRRHRAVYTTQNRKTSRKGIKVRRLTFFSPEKKSKTQLLYEDFIKKGTAFFFIRIAIFVIEVRGRF